MNKHDHTMSKTDNYLIDARCKLECSDLQNTQDILACYKKCNEKTKQHMEDQKVLERLSRLTEQDTMRSYHECLRRHADRGLDGSRSCMFPSFF